jgi:hypothetical protein
VVAATPYDDFSLLPPGTDLDEYKLLSYEMGAPQDPDNLTAPMYEHKSTRLLNFTIGPKATITASDLTAELRSNAGMETTNGTIGRFFFEEIVYQDIYHRRHVSKYCFRIDAFTIEGTTGRIHQLQSLCRHWNCTDDTCKGDLDSYTAQTNVLHLEWLKKYAPRNAK